MKSNQSLDLAEANVNKGIPLPPNFDDLAKECGVEPDNLDVLRQNAIRILSLGRRSVDQTFDYGSHLAETVALLPPGSYGKWIERMFGISRRHGDNFIRVHTDLGHHRRRFVAAGVSSTVLFTLAGRSPDEVETVLKLFESGQRPTVREIANLLKGQEDEVAPEVNLSEVGGIAGLRALGQSKLKAGIPSFCGHMNYITDEIEVALEPFRRGKRVVKAKLAEKVQQKARRAQGELKNLALFVTPQEWGPEGVVVPLKFPSGSGWGKVAHALYQLGGVDSWPSADNLGGWLAEEILPVLRWAVEPHGRNANPEREEVAAPPPLAMEEDASQAETAEARLSKLAVAPKKEPIARKSNKKPGEGDNHTLRRLKNDIDEFGEALSRAL